MVPVDVTQENGIHPAEGLQLHGWSAPGEMTKASAQEGVGEQPDPSGLDAHGGVPEPCDPHWVCPEKPEWGLAEEARPRSIQRARAVSAAASGL